jgi:hypothetical protein
MEDDKIYEMGHFLNFHFKHFLVDYFKPKPSAVQKYKHVLLYCIYHKYIHYFFNLIFFSFFQIILDIINFVKIKYQTQTKSETQN